MYGAEKLQTTCRLFPENQAALYIHVPTGSLGQVQWPCIEEDAAFSFNTISQAAPFRIKLNTASHGTVPQFLALGKCSISVAEKEKTNLIFGASHELLVSFCGTILSGKPLTHLNHCS